MSGYIIWKLFWGFFWGFVLLSAVVLILGLLAILGLLYAAALFAYALWLLARHVYARLR